MSSDLPGKPRAGKYCPRCHTMTLRDQTVCSQCGHHFRSGLDSQPAEAQNSPPDAMNRTMQFVLPPLTPHPAPPPDLGIPSRAPDIFRRAGLATAFAVLALCLGIAGWIWHSHSGPASASPSPVGVWETTLHGKASADAHLEFVFQADGTGQFAWHESGPPQPPPGSPSALSGQTLLHWEQNPDGTLTLTMTKAADEDSISQTLVNIFSSHHWTWHRDPARHQLVLGTLVFTEKS